MMTSLLNIIAAHFPQEAGDSPVSYTGADPSQCSDVISDVVPLSHVFHWTQKLVVTLKSSETIIVYSTSCAYKLASVNIEITNEQTTTE